MTRTQRIALVVILLSAVTLRLTGLDWDGFQHHHPDERYITWVATTIEFPSIGQITEAAQWRPETSTFNPFHWPPGAGSEGIVVLQGEPRDFAYGHVPLYLGVAATRLVEWVAPPLLRLLPADWSLTADVLNGAGRIEFHHLAAVGRFLTALFDAGTVLFIFLLGRRLYGVAAGLLAAALLSVTVLHIQLAHFFTSDPYLTFFVVAAVYFMVAAHGDWAAGPAGEGRGKWYFILAAIMVGLAIGSKFTAVLLSLPLLWTAAAIGPSSRRRYWALLGIVVAALAFALTNPFAVLDWTCTPPSTGGGESGLSATLSRSCYIQNILTQNAMVSGRADLGFTRQYAGTIPYVYFGEMLVRWGLGPLLGLVALAGLAVSAWDVARSLRGVAGINEALQRLLRQPVVIVLLWVLPYLLLTGGFYVKFLRYMQPIAPFLILFGAALLWRVRRPSVRYALAGIV
ncbi:MAG TPA: glycosyltransferase family 39 protein, partial [Promineifilum sp.]|nr:glycosyltransferase family 39 protein [Promineifilum sp.]